MPYIPWTSTKIKRILGKNYFWVILLVPPLYPAQRKANQTPCIVCSRWKWDPVWCGLQPQQWSCGSFLFTQCWSMSFADFLKHGPTYVVVVKAWWWIHMSIKCCRRWSNTSCICIKLKWYPVWKVCKKAQQWRCGVFLTQCCWWFMRSLAEFPKSGPTFVVMKALWWIHMSTHCSWRWSNTLYMYTVEVGYSLKSF